MPVVGTAFVQVRVLSDRFGSDIGDSVRRGFASANRDIDREGRSAGQRAGRAAASGVEDADSDFDRAGRRSGERVGNSMRDEINRRQKPRLTNLFKGLGGDLGEQFNLGIGAARMGRGIVSALVTAGPSIIAGAGAIMTALATEVITALSAIGPGIAGAVGVGLAGISTLALNAGLLMAAFKSGNVELDALKTRLGDLGKELGKPIAAGMVPGVTKLVDLLTGFLPQINDLLEETGKAFGGVAEKIGETLTNSNNLGRIRTILTTNKTFIDNFGVGIAALGSAFLTLFAAAKPFVDYIGEGIRKFGEWADATLTAAEANGSLAAFMDHMLAKFRELGGVIKDFALGIYNVFSAAAPVGADLLTTIAGVGEKFVAWTSDEGNMARMTAFFEKANTLSGKIFEILGKAFAAGGKAFENMNLDNILHVLDTLANSVGPALADIFNEIQSGAGANLVAMFDNLGVALQKIADSGIIEVLAGAFSSLMLKFSEIVSSDMGAKIAALGLGWILFGGAIQSVLGIVIKLAPAIAGLSGPVLLVVAAVAAAVGVFIEMWRNSEKFRDAVTNLVGVLSGKFSEIWDKLAPKLATLWEKFEKLAGVMGDRLAPIITALTPVVEGFFDVLGTVVSYVVDQVGLFFDFFADILSGDWAGAWDAFTTMIGNLVGLIGDLFTKGRLLIGAALTALGGLIVDFFVGLWNSVKDDISQAWDAILAWLTARWNGIVETAHGFFDPWIEWFSNLWNSIVTQTQAWWNGLGDWFLDRWNGFTGWLSTIFGGWIGILQGFWDIITGAVSTAWTNIGNWFLDRWNGFTGWLTTIFTGWVGILQGLWDIITGAISTAWTNIGNWFMERWNAFTGWLSTIFNGWVGILQGAWDAVTGAIYTAWTAIGSWFSERWNDFTSDLQTVFSGWAGILGGIWDRIASIASSAWGIVRDNIVQPIADAFGLVQGWIDRISGIISGVLQTVSDAYNTVSTKLADTLAAAAAAQAASAAPAAPGTSGNVLGGGQVGVTPGGITKLFQTFIAQQPPVYLATGGTVRATPGGVHAILGEGGRNERVEPLNSNGMSRRDIAMIQQIIESVGSKTEAGTTTVQVRIGERELEDVVQSVISAHDRALARRSRNTRKVIG